MGVVYEYVSSFLASYSRVDSLDTKVLASGFTREMQQSLDEVKNSFGVQE